MPTPTPSIAESTTTLASSEIGDIEKAPISNLEKVETNASALYDSIAFWRKCLIVFTASWVTLSATFSSTSLLSVSTDIAQDLGTTKEIINVSTGGLMLAMGISPFLWSPLSNIFGRRVAYNACVAVLIAFIAGAAVSGNTSLFVAMRVLSGFQGTFFHVSGQTILAEYFPPLQRGTATGFFMAGTVLGPPLGPCVAAIMVEYADWRSTLWLQVAMCGLALVLSLFFIPGSLKDRGVFKLNVTGVQALARFNPLPVFRQMAYPNIIFTHLSCGLMAWAQNSILATPRQVLTDHFGITSPLVAGLFYISPASGFLIGAIIGGKYSDMTVKKWIEKRGERLPQDRLNSGIIAFFAIVPAAALIYGWGMQCQSCTSTNAGLALPIITIFFLSVGIMHAFSSLNTYCAEAIPRNRMEVIAGKYLIQYAFSAATTAASVPLLEATSVGISSTINVIFVLIAGVLTLITAKYGLTMQRWADGQPQEHQTEPKRTQPRPDTFFP